MARTKQTARKSTTPRTGLATFQVSLQDQLDTANAKNKRLEKSRKRQRQQVTKLQQELEPLKKELHASKKRNALLVEIVHVRDMELNDLAKKNDDLKKENDNLVEKVNHRRQQVYTLRESLVDLILPLDKMSSEKIPSEKKKRNV